MYIWNEFGSKIGFEFSGNIDRLFTPLYGSIIVEVDGSIEELLEGINYKVLGKTIEEKHIEINEEKNWFRRINRNLGKTSWKCISSG